MNSSDLRATVTVHAYAVTVVDDSQRGPAPHESQSPPSVVVMPTIDDVVGGVYRLKRLLGAGMFGKVYVAQREDVPEHQVALKILPRSHFAGRNVERELVMLATVGHPHVVQMKDHGTTPEYVWLTMPVYRGETLETIETEMHMDYTENAELEQVSEDSPTYIESEAWNRD